MCSEQRNADDDNSMRRLLEDERLCTQCGQEVDTDVIVFDGEDFCSRDCLTLHEHNLEYCCFGPDYDYGDGDYPFADPGGNSALRAAGPNNPRNLPCPECGCANRLTPEDVKRGYRCDPCADRAERGGW